MSVDKICFSTLKNNRLLKHSPSKHAMLEKRRSLKMGKTTKPLVFQLFPFSFFFSFPSHTRRSTFHKYGSGQKQQADSWPRAIQQSILKPGLNGWGWWDWM
jgi:hypothetical protein